MAPRILLHISKGVYKQVKMWISDGNISHFPWEVGDHNTHEGRAKNQPRGTWEDRRREKIKAFIRGEQQEMRSSKMVQKINELRHVFF